MPKLRDDEIAAALGTLDGWRREGEALIREYRFADFVEAMRFVNRVAEAAEKSDHHPDIDIRYNRVRLALTSHDTGGITERDVRMAKTISSEIAN